MATDDLRFDVRLVERMLSSGRLKREEYQKYLEALPDLSSEAVPVDPGAAGVATGLEASPAGKRTKK